MANNPIQCPFCKKHFFMAVGNLCPFCKRNLLEDIPHDFFNYFKDIFTKEKK